MLLNQLLTNFTSTLQQVPVQVPLLEVKLTPFPWLGCGSSDDRLDQFRMATGFELCG